MGGRIGNGYCDAADAETLIQKRAQLLDHERRAFADGGVAGDGQFHQSTALNGFMHPLRGA